MFVDESVPGRSVDETGFQAGAEAGPWGRVGADSGEIVGIL